LPQTVCVVVEFNWIVTTLDCNNYLRVFDASMLYR